jgi:hypothetical protein
MADNEPQEEGAWPIGWEGHERAQLLRTAAWPLPLKLRWLEEAQVVAEHLRSQWKQRNDQPAAPARDENPPLGGASD